MYVSPRFGWCFLLFGGTLRRGGTGNHHHRHHLLECGVFIPAAAVVYRWESSVLILTSPLRSDLPPPLPPILSDPDRGPAVCIFSTPGYTPNRTQSATLADHPTVYVHLACCCCCCFPWSCTSDLTAGKGAGGKQTPRRRPGKKKTGLEQCAPAGGSHILGCGGRYLARYRQRNPSWRTPSNPQKLAQAAGTASSD